MADEQPPPDPNLVQCEITKQWVPADEIVTHEIPLEQHEDAFKMVLAAKESIKVMLVP